MRPLALALLLLSGCKLYNPELVDCSLHCAADGTCPTDTVCKDGYCRLPTATNRCDCRPGDDRPCGGGKGACAPGLQRCGSEGTWSACLGEIKPVPETCDNKDNDCDGVIDNSPTDAPPCEKHAGVCALAVQHCVGGRYVDCTVADYPATYQPQETLCDSLDNDCDGIVDGTGDRLLSTGVVGDWDFLAYPGGFALLAVRASAAHPGLQDVTIDRFDEALLSTGPTLVLGSDASVKLAARNDGATVYAVWSSGARFEARKVARDGSISPLTGLASVDIAGSFQLGLSPTTLVAAFEGANNAARSVEWPLAGGAPISRQLNVNGAGVTTSSMYSVLASRGGKFVAYYGNGLPNPDGGSSDSLSRVLLTGGLGEVSAAYPGPSGANFFESNFDTAVSIYDSSFFSFFGFPPSSSGIYLQTNVLDGGPEYTVKEANDLTQYSDCHAVPVPKGAVLAYVDNNRGQVTVASQAQIGQTTIIHSRAIDSDAGYGPPRVASNGTDFLGLAVRVYGNVYARRLCAP